MKTVIMLLILVVPVALCDGYETITGHTGENVTLMCLNCSSNHLSTFRVQKRGSSTYIDYCRDEHPIRPDDEDPLVVGRVERMKCPMTGGNFSVNVTGLTTNDTDLYDWRMIYSDGTDCNCTNYLEVTDRGAADVDNRTGDDVRGNPTSGNHTSGNPTSGNHTSGNPTSGNSTSVNHTSGNPPHAGAIAGGTVAAFMVIVIIVIAVVCYLYRDRLKSWKMRCRNRNQQNSEPPVTYREVNQQQV